MSQMILILLEDDILHFIIKMNMKKIKKTYSIQIDMENVAIGKFKKTIIL